MTGFPNGFGSQGHYSLQDTEERLTVWDATIAPNELKTVEGKEQTTLDKLYSKYGTEKVNQAFADEMTKVLEGQGRTPDDFLQEQGNKKLTLPKNPSQLRVFSHFLANVELNLKHGLSDFQRTRNALYEKYGKENVENEFVVQMKRNFRIEDESVVKEQLNFEPFFGLNQQKNSAKIIDGLNNLRKPLNDAKFYLKIRAFIAKIFSHKPKGAEPKPIVAKKDFRQKFSWLFKLFAWKNASSINLSVEEEHLKELDNVMANTSRGSEYTPPPKQRNTKNIMDTFDPGPAVKKRVVTNDAQRSQEVGFWNQYMEGRAEKKNPSTDTLTSEELLELQKVMEEGTNDLSRKIVTREPGIRDLRDLLGGELTEDITVDDPEKAKRQQAEEDMLNYLEEQKEARFKKDWSEQEAKSRLQTAETLTNMINNSTKLDDMGKKRALETLDNWIYKSHETEKAISDLIKSLCK